MLGVRGPSHVVVVMPARNSAKTLRDTWEGLPSELRSEVVLVDNCSSDDTVRLAEDLGIHVVRHTTDRGYGGSLKSCLTAALGLGADLILEFHPDNQYGADAIGPLLDKAREGDFAIVMGSRFIPPRRALDGHMPLWKFLFNRALSWTNGRLLGVSLSEFHSGLRVYGARFVRSIPYQGFSDDFVFSFETIAAAAVRRWPIAEVAASSRYFPECSSNRLWSSLVYGLGTLAVSLRSWLIMRGFERGDLFGA